MDHLILESYEQSKGNWIIRVFLDEKTTVFLHSEEELQPTQEKVNFLMENYLKQLKKAQEVDPEEEVENGSQN
jgi:hypothetical protein|tara:strand:+ start:1585 stop:1803 length:219 start_codon:yes stop_codon:yes gene_type:complete